MATAQGITVCPVMLGERVIYQDAYAQGQAVTEAEPFGKASQEIREVYMYASGLLGLPTARSDVDSVAIRKVA